MLLCDCGATCGATLGGCLATIQDTQGDPCLERQAGAAKQPLEPTVNSWLCCWGFSPLLRAQVQRQGSMRRQLSHMGELVHSALGDAHTSTQACAPCIRYLAQYSGHALLMQDAWLCQCLEHTLLGAAIRKPFG